MLIVLSLLYRLPCMLLVLGVYSTLCYSKTQQQRYAPVALTWLTWFLPNKRIDALQFGRLVGSVIFYIYLYSDRFLHKRKKRTLFANIDIAFGDTLSAEQRQTLARKSYQFNSMLLCDWLLIGRISGADLRAMIALDDPTAQTQLLADMKEQGAILLGMHNANPFFSFVIDDALRQHANKHIAVFARKQVPLIDALSDVVVSRTSIHIVLKKHNSAAHLIKAIKQGNLAYLTPDINVDAAELFHSFCGEQASVAPGIYRFAQRMRCPVYSCACYVDADWSYKIRLQKIDYDTTADDAQVQQQIVSQYFAFIESIVDEFPDQYKWSHARWRARPSGDTRQLYMHEH